jgi:hypothetical protein
MRLGDLAGGLSANITLDMVTDILDGQIRDERGGLVQELEGYEWLEDDLPDRGKVQAMFFISIFSILGHLSTIDGDLATDEASYVNHFMKGLGLPEEHKVIANIFFNLGGQATVEEIYNLLSSFETLAEDRKDLLKLFIEILVVQVYIDNRSHYKEREALDRVSKILHIPRCDVEAIENRVKSENNFT